MKIAAALLSFSAALTASAQALPSGQAGELKAFAACPVYRDTDDGIKSGCWLATDPDSGVVYDVSRAPTKPDWNFGVLVEGYVEEGAPNTCGGVVLNPMRLSLLRDRPCVRRVLPAEGYPGVKFRLPGRTVQPLHVPRKPPEPPLEDVAFNLFFDYNRDFLVYQLDDYLMDEAANHIVLSSPKRVTVTGYTDRIRPGTGDDGRQQRHSRSIAPPGRDFRGLLRGLSARAQSHASDVKASARRAFTRRSSSRS